MILCFSFPLPTTPLHVPFPLFRPPTPFHSVFTYQPGDTSHMAAPMKGVEPARPSKAQSRSDLPRTLLSPYHRDSTDSDMSLPSVELPPISPDALMSPSQHARSLSVFSRRERRERMEKRHRRKLRQLEQEGGNGGGGRIRCGVGG